MPLPATLTLVHHAHEPAPRDIPLEDVYRYLEVQRPPGRPAVILNMAQTLDGVVAIDGKTWVIGSEVDHYLFRTLRGWADVVLSGAGTLRLNDVVPRTHPLISEFQYRNPGLREWYFRFAVVPTTARESGGE